MANGEEQDATFIRVTNRDIYIKLEALDRDVSDIKISLAGFHEERLDTRRRVRSLEMKVYVLLAGLISGWGASAAIFVGTRGHTG